MALFLAPAHADHARQSLFAPADRGVVEVALGNKQQFEALIKEIGVQGFIYCWAVRDSKLGVFVKMRFGDEVMFSVPGSGVFALIGTIVATLESNSFARKFWEDKDLHNWRLIYFLKNMEKVNIPKETIRKWFGYDKNDRFQGLRWINPERMKGYPTMRALIRAMQ